MIFLHHSAFNHPGRVMMLIMIFICYIPGSLQKQRQDKLCSERIVLVLRIRKTTLGCSGDFEKSNMLFSSGK